MRISDWSSDVCSSDLQHMPFGHPGLRDRMPRNPVYQGLQQAPRVLEVAWRQAVHELDRAQQERVALQRRHRARRRALGQIGRASCRERGGPYVYISGVSVSLKKKKKLQKNIKN